MKITKTYSIEDDIYKSFDKLTNVLNINKSSIIEDKIKDYLKDNGISDYKTYFLISNPDYEVTIESQDDNFIFLSDGSKILKQVFNSSFKVVDRIDPIDPVSFFKSSPLIIKLLMPNMDKFILTSKLDDKLTFDKLDKLEDKIFIRNIDNKLYKVVNDKKSWVRLRPNDYMDRKHTELFKRLKEHKGDFQTAHDDIFKMEEDIDMKKDTFLSEYKPYNFCHVSIGNFGFEYLGKSRIDDNPIFKLGGGIFIQFFNSDVKKLKEFIMNNKDVVILTNNNSENLYIHINDIEIVHLLDDLIPDISKNLIPDISKEQWNIKKNKVTGEKEIKDAVNDSIFSDIKASHWENDYDATDVYEKENFYEKIKTNSDINGYEELLMFQLNKFSEYNLEERKLVQITLMKNILDDLKNGIFQKEFTSSERIRNFMKKLEIIKTPDPNDELSKLKYELLLKIVQFHNKMYL